MRRLKLNIPLSLTQSMELNSDDLYMRYRAWVRATEEMELGVRKPSDFVNQKLHFIDMVSKGVGAKLLVRLCRVGLINSNDVEEIKDKVLDVIPKLPESCRPMVVEEDLRNREDLAFQYFESGLIDEQALMRLIDIYEAKNIVRAAKLGLIPNLKEVALQGLQSGKYWDILEDLLNFGAINEEDLFSLKDSYLSCLERGNCWTSCYIMVKLGVITTEDLRSRIKNLKDINSLSVEAFSFLLDLGVLSNVYGDLRDELREVLTLRSQEGHGP